MRSFKLPFLLLTVLVLSGMGCATLVSPKMAAQVGALPYASVDYGSQAMNNEVGTLRGESCRVTYLGFITFDPAPTIRGAAMDVGIREVGSINGSFTSFLGLYSKQCVIITGS